MGRDMGTPAIGFYIDRLTVLRGMKIGGVATAAGVKPGSVSRLISGDIKEPSARVLKVLSDAVEGSWNDSGVSLDDGATQDQAELLTDAWYARTSNGADTTGDSWSRSAWRRIVAHIDGPDDPASSGTVLRRWQYPEINAGRTAAIAQSHHAVWKWLRAWRRRGDRPRPQLAHTLHYQRNGIQGNIRMLAVRVALYGQMATNDRSYS